LARLEQETHAAAAVALEPDFVKTENSAAFTARGEEVMPLAPILLSSHEVYARGASPPTCVLDKKAMKKLATGEEAAKAKKLPRTVTSSFLSTKHTKALRLAAADVLNKR
jgi:hypothetical protein